MPAQYAHYRFGKQIYAAMPAEERQCVQRFRRMFDMGLQGPDFFFYYNPFMKTAVGDLGRTFHRQTGQEFFSAACAAAGTEAARSYLYGLLGHYCLDSACHPYVNRLVQIGEAQHVLLESEFERYLLTQDKKPSPETCDMSRFLRVTRGECMTIAEFYPGVQGGQVSRSIKSMASSIRFLANPRHKKLLQKIKPSLVDHMIPAEENEDLALYVMELQSLYEEALQAYPALLRQLTEFMDSGEPLGEDFGKPFG